MCRLLFVQHLLTRRAPSLTFDWTVRFAFPRILSPDAHEGSMNESASSARGPALFPRSPPDVPRPSGRFVGRPHSFRPSRLAPLLGDDQPTVISQSGRHAGHFAVRFGGADPARADSARRTIGALRAAAICRRRRDGQGVPRPRYPLGPQRGLEDPLAGARGGPRNGAAVPERGPVGRAARSRQYRPRLLCGRRPRTALYRLRVHRGGQCSRPRREQGPAAAWPRP